MTTRMASVVAMAVGTLALAGPAIAAPQAPPPASLHTAAAAIKLAVSARLGGEPDVTVVSVDVKGDAPAFREARPDPAARLGKPMRFTLLMADGTALAATASVTVVASHAVVRQALARGQIVAAADVDAVRAELTGTPLGRMPAAGDVVGTRVLRPMAAGTVILPAFVALRRTVEPGDAVTVVALAGAIEVTATFVAADGGDVGDTIRVRNPDTKKYLRGRVVKAGLVEVIHEH